MSGVSSARLLLLHSHGLHEIRRKSTPHGHSPDVNVRPLVRIPAKSRRWDLLLIGEIPGPSVWSIERLKHDSMSSLSILKSSPSLKSTRLSWVTLGNKSESPRNFLRYWLIGTKLLMKRKRWIVSQFTSLGLSTPMAPFRTNSPSWFLKSLSSEMAPNKPSFAPCFTMEYHSESDAYTLLLGIFGGHWSLGFQHLLGSAIHPLTLPG